MATILDIVRSEVGSVQAVAFAQDGSLLAVAGPGGVTLRGLADGRSLGHLEEAGVEAVAFTADASRLLLGISEGRLCAWDVEGANCVQAFDLSPGRVLSVALSPDGNTVAAASSEGTVVFLDAETWSLARTIDLTGLGSSTVYRWLFSPDGQACAGSLHISLGGPIGRTFTPDRYEIVLWEPGVEAEPDLDRTLLGHLGWIGGLDFSPRGRLLASGAYDESVRLWDWEQRALLSEGREHTGPVYGVSFSPSGELLASCSADGTIKLWSVAEAMRPPLPLPVSEGTPRRAEELLRMMLEASAPRDGIVVVAQEFLDSMMWTGPTISRSAVEEAVAEVKAAFGDTAAAILFTAVQTAVQLRLEQAFREGEPEAAFYESLGTWITHGFFGEEPDAALRGLERVERPVRRSSERTRRPTSRVRGRSRRLATLVDNVAEGVLAPEAAITIAQDLRTPEADIRAACDRVEERVRDALAGHANPLSLANAAEVLYRLAEPTGEPSLLTAAAELVGTLTCIAGDNAGGLAWLEGALGSAREVGDPGLLGATLGNLANCYRNLGRLRDSLAAYEEVLALAERHGLARLLVEHLNNVAIVYADLGDASGQGQALRRARAEAEALGLDRELAVIATNLGDYLWRAGDYRAAIRAHEDALAAADRLDDDHLRAAALGNLGLVHAAEGDTAAARATFLAALELAERIGEPTVGANAAVGLGKLDAADGRLLDAQRAFERGVELALGTPPGVLMAALVALGDTQHRLGQTDAAIATLREAATAGERLRAQIEQPGTAERIQHRMADVYARLVSLTVGSGRVEDAFMFSERARAALLTRRLRPRSDAGDDVDVTVTSVLEQLRRHGSAAVLISYFITGETVWSFVLRADSGALAVTRRGIETERFQRLVRNLASEVAEAPLYGDVGETWLELGEWLIDPLLEHLRDGDVLFLVPHGLLHNLPLHALKVEGQRLIERWPIAYLPAASALSALIDESAERPRAPLVIGVAFVDEARAVATLLEGAETLIGEQLGRNTVLEALSRADLVHVSAYGFFAEDEPDRSGWLLRSSEDVMRYLAVRARPSYARTQWDFMRASDEVLPREAIVTAADLEDLPLRARLITLSACESGLVRTDPADDPVGLVPALLASGVPAIVATLWLVDPEATEQVMLALYRRLLRSDLDWRRKPQALRAAVLELMQTHPHPYYWAPFVLIGGAGSGVADAMGRADA